MLTLRDLFLFDKTAFLSEDGMRGWIWFSAMNRTDFQNMANMRLKDTLALLKEGCYAGAYYLAGYVVECGLKACIAKQTKEFDFPPDPKTVRDSIYVHDIPKLIKSAGLGIKLDAECKKNGQFQVYWGIVKDWDEKSRYETHTPKDAQDLYNAISDASNGVLQWLKRYW